MTSRITRQEAYIQLGDLFQVSPSAIRSTLRKRGYVRRIALRKLPISEKNKTQRLEWAHEHRHWTEEQWSRVLWPDERFQRRLDGCFGGHSRGL